MGKAVDDYDPYIDEAVQVASAISYESDQSLWDVVKALGSVGGAMVRDDLRKTGINVAGMTAGLPGDMADLGALATNDYENAHYPVKLLQSMKGLPNSDELIESWGGDTEHWSYWPAALASPGPGELGAGLKALGKGALEYSPNLAAIVFHASPHRFNIPSNRFMGTGEGAQAYGWGHYVAENPGVAGSYRVGVAGSRRPVRADNVERLVEQEGSEKAAMEYLQRRLNENIRNKNHPQIEKYKEEMAILRDGSYKGHLYEYDIPDEEVAKMLDWDAPMSEQPGIKKKIAEYLPFDSPLRERLEYGDVSNITGGQLYRMLGDELSGGQRRVYGQSRTTGFSGDRAASEWLGNSDPNVGPGIPGIKYLDGTSRRAGEGTRNLVLFDPENIVRSVKRDGELVYENIPTAAFAEKTLPNDPTAGGRALMRGEPTTSGVDNVTDLVQRRKEINQEHDRVINEIRMRATEDLQDMKTASRLESVDPESIHKIGDRFVAEGPAIVGGNEMPGNVRLEIKKYNRVGDDGTVYYDVEQTFPDGSKGMVTLRNDNLVFHQKMGGFEVVKPTTSGVTQPGELFDKTAISGRRFDKEARRLTEELDSKKLEQETGRNLFRKEHGFSLESATREKVARWAWANKKDQQQAIQEWQQMVAADKSFTSRINSLETNIQDLFKKMSQEIRDQ